MKRWAVYIGKTYLWLSGIALAFAAIVAFIPEFAGGAYSVLALPFYKLACVVPTASGITGALLGEPPAPEDYARFLMNEGCHVSDPEPHSILDAYSDESVFWGNDIVGNFFHNIATLMAKHFTEGVAETTWFFIPLLRERPLVKAAYFVVYSVLLIVLAQLLNLFLQAQFKKRFPSVST